MTLRAASLLAVAVLGAGCRDQVHPVGVVMSHGMDAAARAAAEVPGPAPVQLLVMQASTGSADLALRTARELVAERAVAVVGHSNSAASLAASQVYNRAGVVQIAPTSTATAYERAGAYSFRLVPSDREQARLLLHHAERLAAGGGVAVIYENDAYGYGLYRDLVAAADSEGVALVGSGSYLVEEPVRLLRDVTRVLLQQRPAALVWIGRIEALGAVLPELRSARVEVVASDGVDTGELFRHLEEFQGLYLVRLLDCAVLKRGAAELRGRLDMTGLGAEGLLTYDAVGLVRAALAAGARDGDGIRKYLLTLGRSRPAYAGVTGPIQFDETRSVERPWRLARITPDSVMSLEPEQ